MMIFYLSMRKNLSGLPPPICLTGAGRLRLGWCDLFPQFISQPGLRLQTATPPIERIVKPRMINPHWLRVGIPFWGATGDWLNQTRSAPPASLVRNKSRSPSPSRSRSQPIQFQLPPGFPRFWPELVKPPLPSLR